MVNIAASVVGATRLARLVQISQALNSASNVDALLRRIVEEAAHLVDAQAASILLLDPDSRDLRFRATAIESHSGLVDVPVPVENSIAGAVLTENTPIVLDNVARDPRWNPQADRAVNFQTVSLVGMPMPGERGAIGVLEALNKHDNGVFDEEDVATLAMLATLAAAAVEKAQLIDELQTANQQLSELDQLKNDFLAVMSHELRTPLAIIVGYMTLLTDQRDQLDGETQQRIVSARKAALRLRELIQAMFNLKYIDAGQATLNITQFDVSGLVTGAVGERVEMAQARNQRISFQLPEESLEVMADRNMVAVIVGNLLNNALKFSPPRSVVDVAIAGRSDEVWIKVRDRGPGIPPDKLERIFDRFYQVESNFSRSFEGMGMGLAIASELVMLHGGRIWARNAGDRGAIFHVALPRVQPPPASGRIGR